MYTSYYNYPSQQEYTSWPGGYSGYAGNPQMYTQYQTQPGYGAYDDDHDDRLFAPFVAPFLLGGLAGAAAAPYFYRPYPYPYPYYY